MPIVLAGLKNDLRSNVGIKDGMPLVTELDGRLVALRIGAKSYVECSSRSGDGVFDVFGAAAHAAALQLKKRVRTPCVVL